MSHQAVIDKITDTFVVSQKEAESYAREFVDLVESHGGLLTQSVIDNQIPKVFGDRLTWRNGKKETANRNKELSAQSYNEYINANRNPLNRKW